MPKSMAKLGLGENSTPKSPASSRIAKKTASKTRAPQIQPVKSADRTLALLEFVAAENSVNFTQILKDLNIPRSSAHGLLKILISSGWLGQDPDSKEYSLGLRAWQVGQLYRGHYHLVDIAKPIMDRLASTMGETVQLARLDGIENVYIAISESNREMRLSSRVGGRLLAHATGIGKALLSMKDPLEVEALLRSSHLPQYTRNTVTDVDQLMKLISSVNEEGFAIDDEEYVSGCRCVAVPLMKDLNGQSLTALSITIPTSRTDKNWPLSIVEPLKLAAQEIRSIIGTTEQK